MRLSELRTCDSCGSPILQPPARWFWTVAVTGALLNPRAFMAVELAARHGLPLCRVEGDADAVTVLGEESPAMLHTLQLCSTCLHTPIVLATLVQRRRDADDPGPSGAAA